MADALTQFRAYDFEGNPRWQQYKSSIEVPAGRNVDAALARIKAKWYKREVDPSFDISLLQSTGGAAQAQPETPSTSYTQDGGNGATREPAAGYKPTSGASPAQSPKSGFLEKALKFIAVTPEDRLAFLHCAILLFGALHLLTMFRPSTRFWSYFMQSALLAHGYKTYLRYGVPKLWPFKLQNFAAWLQPASVSTDFQYALLALIFMASKPVLLMLQPFMCLALYHVAAYGAQHYSHKRLWQRFLAQPYQTLAANKQQALFYNTASEIGVGFLLIVGLFAPPRNIFLVFIYWQFLRTRYWSPDSASLHRTAWSQLDARIGRYLEFLPILKVPIGYVQRWFQSAGGA